MSEQSDFLARITRTVAANRVEKKEKCAESSIEIARPIGARRKILFWEKKWGPKKKTCEKPPQQRSDSGALRAPRREFVYRSWLTMATEALLNDLL